MGAKQVSFGGGEPATSPVLCDLLQRVAALGLSSEVFTSGVSGFHSGPVPFPEELIEKMLGIERLNLIFSVHGATSRTHDCISQTEQSFECMLDSLTRCLRAGVRCELNFVPLAPNAPDFPRVAELAATHGITRISVLRFVPQGRGRKHRKELELSIEGEDAFLDELLRVRDWFDGDIRTGSPFNGIISGNQFPCRAGAEKIVVQADGNVLPCEVFKETHTRDWGASVYAMSLQQILESPQFRAFRKIVLAQECALCPVHTMLRAEQLRRSLNGRGKRKELALQL